MGGIYVVFIARDAFVVASFTVTIIGSMSKARNVATRNFVPKCIEYHWMGLFHMPLETEREKG